MRVPFAWATATALTGAVVAATAPLSGCSSDPADAPVYDIGAPSDGGSSAHADGAAPAPPGDAAAAAADADAGREDFVTRQGTRLFAGARPFRFAGPNVYWLGLDENVGPVGPPSHARVDEALAIAERMGATVVRAHTLGVSTGCAACIEPARGTFNEDALAHVDYAVRSARDHGVRLVVPLTDNYHYYHGGKHDFTDWEGVAEDQFYSNTKVLADFEAYVHALVTRVSSLTGVAYKDDPTIVAWETGNELTKPPASWTATIAAYLKSIDPHHLVIDGAYGVDSAALGIADVDIYSDHFYPPSVATLKKDAALTTGANKVLLVGELDWAGAHGGDDLATFLAAIEGEPGIGGDAYWSLFGHDDACASYVAHADGFTLHYPGDTPDMQQRARALAQHARTMSGLPEVTTVASPCPVP